MQSEATEVNAIVIYVTQHTQHTIISTCHLYKDFNETIYALFFLFFHSESSKSNVSFMPKHILIQPGRTSRAE